MTRGSYYQRSLQGPLIYCWTLRDSSPGPIRMGAEIINKLCPPIDFHSSPWYNTRMKKRTATISVLLIPADLTRPTSMVTIRRGDYALIDMYNHMDCDYVQRLATLKKNMILWVDEEGSLETLKRKPVFNVRASILGVQPIMGNAILAGQDSLYGVDGIEFDTIKEMVKRLENSAQQMIAEQSQPNQ